MSEITRIFHRVSQGDPAAPEELWRLVYDELRKIAGGKMLQESATQTLQPTALVHEAWLRLGADAQPTWKNRAHFFTAAAEAMRRTVTCSPRDPFQLAASTPHHLHALTRPHQLHTFRR